MTSVNDLLTRPIDNPGGSLHENRGTWLYAIGPRRWANYLLDGGTETARSTSPQFALYCNNGDGLDGSPICIQYNNIYCCYNEYSIYTALLKYIVHVQ